MAERSASRIYRSWAAPILMSVVLIGISTFNYLLFHTLAEAFSVFVAVLMLATAWYTYPHSRDGFLLFLGCGYFWVGTVDLLHALAYKGMSIFPGVSADPATQLWLVARYMEAFILLAAPLFLNRHPRRVPVFAAIGLVIVILCVAVATGRFPTAYVDGIGLTTFKVASEYAIVAILLLALFHVDRRADCINRGTFDRMVAAIVLTCLAELSFTLYVGISGPLNVTGHVLKLLSFWIIFYAIIRTTLEKPYVRLEHLVAERTAALREREARLRLAIEAAALGEAEVDYETGTVITSARFREMFGVVGNGPRTLAEFRALFHPEDRDRVSRRIEDALARGRPRLGLEFRVLRPDGKVSWVELLGGRAYRESGKGPRAIAVLQDITVRKQAEEALRDSEERFRQFAENVNAVLWIADARTQQLEYLSPAFADVWGEQADGILADNGRWAELIHPEDREPVLQALRQLRSGGADYEIEYRIVRPSDGAVRWIRGIGFSIRNEAGEVQRIAGIARDVTLWKEAGTALRESEEMFRALFRWSPVAITITRLDDDRIVDVNDAWLGMMGYEREEVIGRKSVQLGIWPTSVDGVPQFDDKDPGMRLPGMEQVVRRKDGTSITLLSFDQRIMFKGRPHVIGIALDVTERKEAEQRQRMLMREVDHRGKNTLAVVQALIRLTKADTVEAFVKSVHGRVGALAQAHSLLAQSRWQGADLEQLIEVEMRPYLGDLGARSCLSGPPVNVAADAVQPLGMVFHELATNAAKYGALSRLDGAVELTWAQSPDGGLRFVWRETGGPPVQKPTRRGFGTKMIAAAVVNQLGGEVDFRWDDGFACEFTIAGDRVVRDERETAGVDPSITEAADFSLETSPPHSHSIVPGGLDVTS